MSDDNKNPEVEQEQNNDEVTEETTEEESEDVESSDELDDKDKEIAKLSRLVKKLSKSQETTPENNSSNNQYEQRIERLELKQDGYSDDVIEQIMGLGGKSALSNKVVKTAVDVLVQQEKVEAAGAVDGATQSATKSNVSLEELKSMSLEEMEKHLPKA